MPQGFIGFVGGSDFDAVGRYECVAEPKDPGRGAGVTYLGYFMQI